MLIIERDLASGGFVVRSTEPAHMKVRVDHSCEIAAVVRHHYYGRRQCGPRCPVCRQESERWGGERKGEDTLEAKGLPEKCVAVRPGSVPAKELCTIFRGERGFHPMETRRLVRPHETLEQARNRLNKDLGVSRAQAEAMLAGSICGWECRGADPVNYDENGRPKVASRERDGVSSCAEGKMPPQGGFA